jgi:hypothetical protein
VNQIVIIGPFPKIEMSCRDLGWTAKRDPQRHHLRVTTAKGSDVRPVFGMMGLRTCAPFAQAFLAYGWADAFHGIEFDEAEAVMRAKRFHMLTYAEARAL